MPDQVDKAINQHSSLVSMLAIVMSALDSYGLDSRAIVAQAGIDADKIFDPSRRISAIKLKRLWDMAAEHSGDPCFGLTCAEYFQPSALHGLGFSWIASHSLKEGLERLVRFQRIVATDLSLALRETKAGYSIYGTVSQKENLFNFSDSRYHALIASIYKMCQIMLGPDIKPVRVRFEHAAPIGTDRFEQFFRIPVSFGCDETAIKFDKKISELPASSANPELTRVNDQVVIDYLDRFERGDIATQTRKYIIDHLPSGAPRQAIIANDLNMSLRNFQRRLSAIGTSYGKLLSQVRHEMAGDYLRKKDYQVIEIAYLLGFADPSNFSRAFKRWTGLSPTQFRDQLPAVSQSGGKLIAIR